MGLQNLIDFIRSLECVQALPISPHPACTRANPPCRAAPPDVCSVTQSHPTARHTPEGQVRLQNITTAPYAELDLDKCRDCSLYSLDLWPVSHVRVVPLAT